MLVGFYGFLSFYAFSFLSEGELSLAPFSNSALAWPNDFANFGIAADPKRTKIISPITISSDVPIMITHL